MDKGVRGQGGGINLLLRWLILSRSSRLRCIASVLGVGVGTNYFLNQNLEFGQEVVWCGVASVLG